MLPRWLWRLLPALTVALLGLLVASGPASAFQPHHAPTFTAYVYDHPDGSDILAGATTERGPPTTYDRDTTHVADDQWSSGASAYSDGPIPPAAIDDDHPDVLAQLVRATATTDASSIAFHRSRVAANAVRPSVTDARLGRALADDFRGGPNPIGNGSALDAARHTVDTGQLVGGSTHLEKAVEMRDRYARILRRGGLSSADEAVAQGRYDAYSSFVIENDLDAMMRARGLR